MTSTLEAVLRARVRGELPPHAFRRRPGRILLAIPLLAAIVGASWGLAVAPLPWYLALMGSLVISQLYVALMFFGHEVAHGATVRSQRFQNAVLACSLPVFVVSPHLWRHWHNRLHHRHTNVPGIDPDRYDRLEELASTPPLFQWFTMRLAPGSGHWMSAFYLFITFTLHGQVVLWVYSRRRAPSGYRWARAVLETALIAAGWIALGAWLGPRGAVLVILLPMLLANATVMAYITTNHMLRPLTREPNTLGTSMSVTTLRLLDLIHLHFSHHIEHHLFPALSHRYYPLVRQSLRRHAPDLYLAPTHWQALATLYTTPRYYAEDDVFLDPRSGRRIPAAEVEARLRAAEPAPPAPPTPPAPKVQPGARGRLVGGPTP